VGRIRLRLPVVLGVLAGACAALALAVAAYGGLETRIAGVRVSSRSWERPAAIALVFGVAWLVTIRRRLAAGLDRASAALPGQHGPLAVAVLAALWAGYASVAFGTFAAGGADSYGYISQADLLSRGQLTERIDIANTFTWPHVPMTLTPLGFTPGPARAEMAPTYPPGLPLLMAPLTRLHANAVFIVVPVCAIAVVLITFALGRVLGQPLAGAGAAALVAMSPTFLFQAIQPMSDVPATAFWLGALLAAARAGSSRAAVAGVLTAAAILIRPNLAPLTVFPLSLLIPGGRTGLRRAAVFGACVAAGVAVLLFVQNARYGSPLSSGYGKLEDLFAFSNIGPNLKRYPRWLTESHTAFIWLWLAAPVWIRRQEPPTARIAWTAYSFSFAVWAAYLPYVFFQPYEWFYTRFLLPALPVMLLFGVILLAAAAGRLAPGWRPAIVAAALVGLIVFFHNVSDERGILNLRNVERKYPDVGRYVRDHLPADAFVMARQHSGSLRYYSGRRTLRWDVLDSASLDRALAGMRAGGYQPFAVLDADELIEFRDRFEAAKPGSTAGMFPIATLDRTGVYAFR
jgi:hypothetical protein